MLLWIGFITYTLVIFYSGTRLSRYGDIDGEGRTGGTLHIESNALRDSDSICYFIKHLIVGESHTSHIQN
jgi:hypothetical protein